MTNWTEVFAWVSYTVAIFCLIIGGIMLFRYYKYGKKVTGTVTVKDGKYTFTSSGTGADGKKYIVDKILGLMTPKENVTYTAMVDPDTGKAYIVPYDIMDYRWVAAGLIIIGLLCVILGAVLMQSVKEEKEAEQPNTLLDIITPNRYDQGCGMKHDSGSCKYY